MTGRLLDAGHRMGWVSGDEVFGGNPKLRAAPEEHQVGYVLAVACPAEATTGTGKFRADAPGVKAPKWAWLKLSARGTASTTGPSSTLPNPASPGTNR